MLSVTVQKDINQYKEKIAFGLSARSLVCTLIGIVIGALVAVIGYTVFHIDVEYLSYAIMILVIPFFLYGFWQPMGMNFEQFLPYAISYYFKNNTLLYSSSFALKNKEDKQKMRWAREYRKSRTQKASEVIISRVEKEIQGS